MSSTQGNTAGTKCVDGGVTCFREQCADGCEHLANRVAGLKAKAEQQWNEMMARTEKLPDAQQTKIIECGMRLRELACYYGPYFTQALMITSAEIGAGRLLMPKVANCDRTSGLIFPGLQSTEQVKNPKIIVPGAKGNS